MNKLFIKRGQDEIIVPILIVLVTKLIILFLIPLIAFNLFSIQRVQDLNYLETWNIRDAPHYQSIAEFGYLKTGDEKSYIAFLPFYPLLIKMAVYLLNINYLSASFLISSIASFLLAVVLYKLILLDYNRKIAFYTTLLLFIFPSSFFLHIPYNESTFLSLAVLAFYLIRKRAFLLSSIVIVFATATRIQGLALIPVLYFALFQLRKVFFRKLLFLLFLMGLPLFGIIYYLMINYQLYDDFLYFQKIQNFFWGNNFSLLGGIPRAVDFMLNPDLFLSLALGYSQIIALIFFVLVIIYGFRKINTTYFIYMLSIFILSFPMSFWRSLPRFILVAFPAFLIMSLIVNKHILIRYFVYIIFLALWLIYSAVALSDFFIS